MHDFLEGAIPLLLEKIFKYCIDTKTVSLSGIQSLVECFDYGHLYKTNFPSKVRLEKKNLGQNASQSYCLMIHLPFILFKFKDKLIDIWKPVECLLRMFQIIKFVHITEHDLQDLEKLTQKHLESFMQHFQTHLRPKHHLILHYASVIRSMGPAIYLWVMRMEAKHQYFNRIAQSTKNFVNLKQTLATKHQEMIFHNGFSCSNEIFESKNRIPLNSWNLYEDYAEILDKEITMEEFEKGSIINSVQINNVKYRPKYLVQFNSIFFQIDFIISFGNEFRFLCSKNYHVKEYDHFLNSLLVEKSEELIILKQNELIIPDVYEIRKIKGNSYVIVENLNLFRLSK